MDKLNKILLVGGTLAVGLLFLIFLKTGNPSIVGSVAQSGEYQSTNLISATASTTLGTLLKTGSGVLGSVIFSTTSAQTVTLYDVADAANYASTTLSTKIISFATSTAAGTYTFDLNTYKGLAFFLPVASTKEISITYR